jgi:hypothetical protein
MKRLKVYGLITLMVVAFATGCAQQGKDTGEPAKAPAPGKVEEPKGGPAVQQPAPVQGDPSAHNTQPGEVGLFLNWDSENKATPVCEWTRAGAVQPCANLQAKRDEDGIGYYGMWEHEEPGKVGTTYTLTAQGTAAVSGMTCEIWWKGQGHLGESNGRRCGVTFTLN